MSLTRSKFTLNELTDVQSLKRIAAQYTTEPYWFGLGFIQLKLSDTERMHFWLPEIPKTEREEIHNHRYDFWSTVLAGRMHAKVFNVVNIGVEKDPKHEIFVTNCQPVMTAPNAGTQGFTEVLPCQIRLAGVFEMDTWSEYFFPHTMFHNTEGTEYCITHLTRRLPKILEYASVVKERGAATSCPFAENMALDLCWKWIETALYRRSREPACQ